MGGAAGGALTIRPLEDEDDLRACVELQRETWGEDFNEAVPPSLLRVCQEIGGVAAGAFDPSGRLLGFVFGISGVREGRLVHWSDMLAVRPEARGHGIGRLLKEHQRQAVRAVGVEEVLWSFDPLVATNAHLNLERLGARVVDYVVEMYPASNSDLHRGIGTDRLIVSWPVLPVTDAPADRPAVVGGIEVPHDLTALQRSSLEEAKRWRTRTRQRFLEALGGGLLVIGFERNGPAGHPRYLLGRTEA